MKTVSYKADSPQRRPAHLVIPYASGFSGVVPMVGAQPIEFLLRYWTQRGSYAKQGPISGPRLDIAHQTYYAYLRKYARSAGLKPHDLRHTAAAKHRREHGASIEDVSAFLGHRSIATMARYLARLEGERDNGWQGAA